MDAYRFRSIRAVGAILVLVPALLIFLLFSNEPPVETRTVTATVVDAHGGSDEGGFPVVLVELDGGEYVRLYAGGRSLSVGESLTLVETVYEDGERRYRLQPRRR
ncbi:MAG: hypothetical protein ACQER6_03345 [Pseudomonadota bacterium]